MLDSLIQRFGDPTVLFMGGLLIGLLFGALAQQSRFCLRAATVEFAKGQMGPKTGIWLLSFGTALVLVQAALALGWMDLSQARQLAAVGSISGAVIGGALFGAGMILTRGCASRLLVLSATGNLRALSTGLLLTLIAQTSLRGGLAPLRRWLFGLWTVEGGPRRDLLAVAGLSHGAAAVGALLVLALGLWMGRRNGVRTTQLAAALGAGAAVALGWGFTYAMTQVSFEPLTPESLTFVGPSADTLMGLVNAPTLPLDFAVGVVPGVFLGSGIMALSRREIQLQGFETGGSMIRYGIGAGLMGFGAMLAGGCSVGAGITGTSVFALTAWLALSAMWVGAVVTVWLDERLG